MKLLIIGDPHGSKKVFKAPTKGADIAIIPGDLGKVDLARKYFFKYGRDWREKVSKRIVEKANLEAITSSLGILKFFAKRIPTYFIYGDVEQKDKDIKKMNKKYGFKLPLFEASIRKLKNLHVLNRKKISLKGVKIAGYPSFTDTKWVRTFTPKNKNLLTVARKEENKVRKFFGKLDKVDILLTHQPPYGFLDKVNNPKAPKGWNGKHAGSIVILNYIKKYQPALHICGHIHEAEGKTKIGKTTVINAGLATFQIIDFKKK